MRTARIRHGNPLSKFGSGDEDRSDHLDSKDSRTSGALSSVITLIESLMEENRRLRAMLETQEELK